MKLLLDECVDWRLGASFPDTCEVETVRRAGWSGTKNGALLRRAADSGFDALVTVDRNIEFQQNLNRLPLVIVVLLAGSSDLKELRPLIPRVVSVLQNNPGKRLVNVGAAKQHKANEQMPEFF